MPSHGSITKAGKVRSQTPKIKGRERHSVIARIRNKLNYRKRFTLKRTPGQNWEIRK
ncbi:MAG: 30S ribosomal protein S30e [Candidatus Nitrosocaldaceae archaeon]